MAIRPEGSAERADGRASSKRHNRRWPEILDAAAEVFWRKGYSAASVQEVADAVGVLKGSLYYYIDSKEDLLFSIFERSHGEAVKIVEDVRGFDAPPLERLRVYLERYTEFYLDNIERVSLYFNDSRYLSDERYQIILEQRRFYDDFVIGLIREAQDRGDVDSERPAKYCAYFILGAINALPDWYHRGGNDSAAAIARIYAEQSLAMLTGSISQNR